MLFIESNGEIEQKLIFI